MITPVALHSISLAVAAERSVERVLRSVVEQLATLPGLALARIWLISPANECPTCIAAGNGSDATLRLHLVASAGRSLDGTTVWSRLDGEFHAVRIGELRVGHVVDGGGPILLQRDEPNEIGWPHHPEWIEREEIASFAAHPLVCHGEVIGVIATFSRQALDEEDLARLHELADRSALAIVSSRQLTRLDDRNRLLEQENRYLREEIATAAGIIGKSVVLGKAFEEAELVAATSSTVLLRGESGTGKELFARAIHDRSPRRERSLIKVNCGSIPRELFESEFFGHVKGAFTGAIKDRIGRFQLADLGTLFLDEIGEIPLELQPKLLRALQEGEFERVGDDKTVHVDVRVIAATNRDLLADVHAGRFREDLYYRLNVFPIVLPPLRERVEDIPMLAAHFAERARLSVGRPQFRLSDADLRTLCRYPWPGNVRELANVIERATILSPDGRHTDVASLLTTSEPTPQPHVVTEAAWRELEKQNLLAALELVKGKLYGPGGAAEMLGMKPTTLHSRLRALGIHSTRDRRS